MRASVFCHNLGHIIEDIAPIHGPTAEIHILKPYRPKLLVKSAERFPYGLAEHQKSPGRLFHRLQARVVEIERAIERIDRIAGPCAIQQENFQNERSGSGEPADHKAGL